MKPLAITFEAAAMGLKMIAIGDEGGAAGIGDPGFTRSSTQGSFVAGAAGRFAGSMWDPWNPG